MTRKRKTVVQALEEPMQTPAEILTVNNTETVSEPLIEALNKGKLQALISKFPIYPCISERHPQKIEEFINAYTISLQELKQTIQQIS
jgi:hypothetical protein